MITFSQLEKKGRLGNQMFQIASTIGIANINNDGYTFPKWTYGDNFEKPLNYEPINNTYREGETAFHYSDYKINGNADLSGYFQSEKYWKHIEGHIRNQFEFKAELIESCKSLLPNNEKQNIAIHIRRGDYVNNPSHYNLSVKYYLNALEYFNHSDYNLCFFSDDIEFAKWHFSCLPNAYFIHGTEIEDLCTMTLCDHFIIANSSFSWWAAYLGTKPHSTIIRPKEHFDGNQLKHDIKDLYPNDWVVISDNDKLTLTDTTFIIPVKFDHNDRMANLNLSIQHLQSSFNTNIHVIEQGDKFGYVESFADYTSVNWKEFHRTRMINRITKFVPTEYVVNYDADVLLNPVQIWYSVQLLRASVDVVYPYDGNFKLVSRDRHQHLATNLYWLVGKQFNGPIESWGGAIFMNRKKFLSVGGENEKFISWGPEDAERFNRFLKMGLKVERLKGNIYHLEHYRGQDSTNRNKYIESNRKEWHKIRLMEAETLKEYVKTWEWI